MSALRVTGAILLPIGLLLFVVGIGAMVASAMDEGDNQNGDRFLFFEEQPDEERTAANIGAFAGGATGLGFGLLFIILGAIFLAVGGKDQPVQQQQQVVIQQGDAGQRS